MASSIHQTISQLNGARELALKDAAYYEKIVPGVLPIIGSSAALDLRRWGADFLSETFSSPSLSNEVKQSLSIQVFASSAEGQDGQGGGNNVSKGGFQVLDTLRQYLETTDEDAAVVKSTIQTAASVYPLVFKHIVSNPDHTPTWQTMATIKSNILRRMDSSPTGIRICCIKFVQRVAQAQTPGMIADPRRPDKNDISLTLVPRDHPLLQPANLEAEASGLLDRLLSILQENSSEAILVTATLNSLGSIIRARPSASNRVLSAVLVFNPFNLAGEGPLTPKMRVLVRSMERTTRSLLVHTLKKTPNHPLAPRIQVYLERLSQTRIEVYEDSSRKRGAPSDPLAAQEQAKRQRLGADPPASAPLATPPPLPPSSVSFAQLYTLTQDEGLRTFDVQAIPGHIVVRVLVPMLASVKKEQMEYALNVTRARYNEFMNRPRVLPAPAVPAADIEEEEEEEEDDYEPEDVPTEDAEQLTNKMDTSPPSVNVPPPGPSPPLSALAPIGPFKFPPPPPLTQAEAVEHGKATVDRIFSLILEMESAVAGPRGRSSAGSGGPVSRAGFNRLAASANDRDSWITVLIRLATRAGATTALGDLVDGGELQNGDLARSITSPVADYIRRTLFRYIIEDFRRRIDVAISWLCEEWYNDRIQGTTTDPYSPTPGSSTTTDTPNFDSWALKMFETIMPYLDAKDSKTLIVFLSEIPRLSPELLERVKQLAQDPERVALCIIALHYLIMFRPPVRQACLDIVVELWREYDEARNPAKKLLMRWRPEVLKQAAAEEEAATAAAKSEAEAAAETQEMQDVQADGGSSGEGASSSEASVGDADAS